MLFSKKKVETKTKKEVKPKIKVNAVVTEEDIITEAETMQIIDSVVCDRCGNDMALFRDSDGVKDYVCHFCGKKMTRS